MINNLEDAVDMFFTILEKGYSKRDCFLHIKRQCDENTCKKFEDFLYQERMPFFFDKTFCSDKKCRNLNCDRNYRHIWSRGGYYSVSECFSENCQNKKYF